MKGMKKTREGMKDKMMLILRDVPISWNKYWEIIGVIDENFDNLEKRMLIIQLKKMIVDLRVIQINYPNDEGIKNVVINTITEIEDFLKDLKEKGEEK